MFSKNVNDDHMQQEWHQQLEACQMYEQSANEWAVTCEEDNRRLLCFVRQSHLIHLLFIYKLKLHIDLEDTYCMMLI